MYRQYLELTCVYFHRFSNSLVYLMEYTSKKLACTLPHLVNLPFTMTMTTIWSEAFGTVFLGRNLYAQSLRLVDKANLHVDIPAPPPKDGVDVLLPKLYYTCRQRYTPVFGLVYSMPASSTNTGIKDPYEAGMTWGNTSLIGGIWANTSLVVPVSIPGIYPFLILDKSESWIQYQDQLVCAKVDTGPRMLYTPKICIHVDYRNPYMYV